MVGYYRCGRFSHPALRPATIATAIRTMPRDQIGQGMGIVLDVDVVNAESIDSAPAGSAAATDLKMLIMLISANTDSQTSMSETIC